mgnify:FL=1
MNERQPTGLGKGPGSRLWKEIVALYDLRPDELQVLEEACRETNLVSEMRLELQKSKILTTGSMGQTVVHPLVAELGKHRATVAALLRQLKLPDAPSGVASPQADAGKPSANSDRARAVAHGRWQR